MVISDAERAWCSCAADLGRIPGQIFYVPICPRVEFSYSTGKGGIRSPSGSQSRPTAVSCPPTRQPITCRHLTHPHTLLPTTTTSRVVIATLSLPSDGTVYSLVITIRWHTRRLKVVVLKEQSRIFSTFLIVTVWCGNDILTQDGQLVSGNKVSHILS